MTAERATAEPPAGGLALVVTSPRVAPGLLTRAAWQLIEQATEVLGASPDEPLVHAVAEAGLSVTIPESYAEGSPALARHLVERAGTGPVVWLGSADGDPGLSDAIASEVSRLPSPPLVELVVGSWDVPGAPLLDLVAVMDRLRSPGGCPWDAEQTHESLLPYLAEESQEYAEAVTSGDRRHMAEELGDVLLQVVFHARVAEEHPEMPFDIDDVAGGLIEKLVRRHPHVFADVEAHTAEEVAANWQRIKAEEKAARAGLSSE